MSQDFQAALALHQQGQLDEAEPLYRAVLQAEPDHFNALNNLGLLLAQRERLEEALALTRRAAALDPPNAETLANLGEMLSRAGDHAQARAAFEKSLAVQPANPRTLMRFIRVLRAQDRAEDALPALENASRMRPQSAEIHQMRGALLNGMGRQEEARLAFERAIVLRPNGHYYRDLAIVTRFTPDNKHIANMEAMQRHPNIPLDQAMALHFALGKAYSDIGEHAHSFLHQTEANRRRRLQTQYAEDAELARIEKLKTEFTAETFRAPFSGGDPSNIPVFIVGMPRSGSTLAEQILASHPDIAAIGESPALHNNTAAALGNIDFTDTARLAGDDRLRAAGAAYVAAVSSLHPAAKRIADKMLMNFLYAGLIHLMLPNARIIHIMRDPVDTCLSIFSEEFPAGMPWMFDLGELGRFYRAYAGLMAHWRQVLPPGVMLDVRYEDIVADLEKEARRMVAHVGLEWDAACLAFDKTQRLVSTASAAQVRQPIYRSAIGRWRPDDANLAPLLKALGDLAA
jgi:Tfp pilus assembly protein PilF